MSVMRRNRVLLGGTFSILIIVSFLLSGNDTGTKCLYEIPLPETLPVKYKNSIPREALLTGGKTTVMVNAENGGVVRLGQASIEIPRGALGEDTEITITRLFVTGETGELTNATAGGGGYRFLPAGQTFRSEAIIRLPYDAALDGKIAHKEELATYYFNIKEGRWEALKKLGLEETERVVVSTTTHFTDMINGTLALPEGPEPLNFNINSIKALEAADPSAGVIGLEGLKAGFMGSANFRFAIPVPGGRAGMAPQVSIGYSSDGGNGVLGKGWNLEAGGEVTYDTRRGLPDYGKPEDGKFTLDGVVLKKEPGSTPPYRYTPLKESGFEQIYHYIGSGTNDYWDVTDKRGTVRTYGKNDSWSGLDAGKKYRWLLECVEDSFGNRIRYEYEKDSGEIYIKNIWYTGYKNNTDGSYCMHFEYSNNRDDVQSNGRGKFIALMKKRLDRIETRYNSEPVRSFRVAYFNDDDDPAVVEQVKRLFGITRLARFGEEMSGAGSEYLWKYEFDYEDFECEADGKPILYSEIKEWNWPVSKSFQERSGESGGGSGMISGGAGLGPSPNADARFIASGNFSSTSGKTEIEQTLVDIDGDGKPDIVWIDGNVLKAHLNNGEGFETEEKTWEFSERSGLESVGKEKQKSSSRGWSMFVGTGLPIISPGVDIGRTTQESWSDEELGFSDINGDGLVDIVMKGKEYYWQNTGKEFKKTDYRMAEGASIPADIEPELKYEDILEYDAAFYQQSPFRSWRTPFTGAVKIMHELGASGGQPGSDGIKAYMYAGTHPDPEKFTLDSKKGEPWESSAVLKRGDALYFLSDPGSDIRHDEKVSSDFTWNIKIEYTEMDYFERLNRHLAFFPREIVTEAEYSGMPSWLKVDYRVIETDPETGSPAKYSTENPVYRDWVPPADGAINWAINNGQVIPGILNLNVFEMLADAVNNNKTLLKALYTYYVYDAGVGLLFVNQRQLANLADAEKQILTLINSLTSDERRKMFEVDLRLPGRDLIALVPDFDAGEAVEKYYYGETGEETELGTEGGAGWYRDYGSVFHIDTYEGKDLLYTGGQVIWGDKTAGRGEFTEDSDKAYLTVWHEGYRQDYAFSNIIRQRTILNVDTIDYVTQKLRDWNWLNDAMGSIQWKWISNAWYTALFDYADSLGMGEAVSLAYVPPADPETHYMINDSLSSAELKVLRECITEFMIDSFVSCYEYSSLGEEGSVEENGEYQRKNFSDINILSNEILNQVNTQYKLYGWKNVTRSIRYYTGWKYPVEKSMLNLLMLNDEGKFAVEVLDISQDYSWDSGKDFYRQFKEKEWDLVFNAPYYSANEEEYEAVLDEEGNPIPGADGMPLIQKKEGDGTTIEYRIETVEVLPGGRRQWYYGLWYRGQEDNKYSREPFSEMKLFKQREDARNTSEAAIKEKKNNTSTELEDVPDNSGNTSVYYTPMQLAQWLEEKHEWTIYEDYETKQRFVNDSGNEALNVLGGPAFLSQRRVDGVIKTVSFVPFIAGDLIHTNRAGGDTYQNIPGIANKDSGGSLEMGSLAKSHSKGSDTVITGGFGVISGSYGSNTNNTYQQQGLLDITGSGYSGIVQTTSEGVLVTPGIWSEDGEPRFGASYLMPGAKDISQNYFSVKTWGGSISPSGAYYAIMSAMGKQESTVITAGGSPFASLGLSKGGSEGTNTQKAGLVDLNGDGLPDYFSGGTTSLNIGDNFQGGYSTWELEKISSGSTESSVFSTTIGGGLSGQAPGQGIVTKVGGSVSVSGSLNVSSSNTANDEMLIDMNGDGLPDKVRKKSGSPFIEVAYNTGSSFADFQVYNLGSWGDGEMNLDGEPSKDGFADVKFFGSVDGKIDNINNSQQLGTLDFSGINALDYTHSSSWGLSGGLGVSAQISILIPVFVPFYINISISSGASINWTSFASQVTMRTMDINGDGLPDRVLRAGKKLFVMLNKTGKVGLLKSIRHPQGGSTVIEYTYKEGTCEMPQSRYVMSKVTLEDGIPEGELGYDSVHTFVTEFEYEDGYYDRLAKEQYGFAKVTTIDPFRTRQVTFYNQNYYLKGMPNTQESYNGNEGISAWNRKTLYEYRERPYAQQTKVTTITGENNREITTSVSYEYESGYGNVKKMIERSDGAKELSAEISWWHGGDSGKYFHTHPARIQVFSDGKLIRERNGEYHKTTGALVRQIQCGGEDDNDITTVISRDNYGNLSALQNGSFLMKYEWGYNYQYPVTITRSGGTDAGPYTSKIDWDPVFGVKTEEKDENNSVMRYTYDEYGRLTGVYSPYDENIPAVSYEYNNNGNYWYTVTRNKVSFDPGDDSVLRTVMVIDGLGKTLITAKDGMKRVGNTDIEGWNIAGPVSVDEKGRKLAQGQNLFLSEPKTGVEDVISYRYYPRESGNYGLKYPTVTRYDTQDRPVLVELPYDNARQEKEYSIEDSGSVVKTTDPMKNITIQKSDARGNIIEVLKCNNANAVLTKATYEYDAIGQMLKAIDHDGNVLSLEYDLMGRHIAMTSNDMGRKEYHFDKYGNLSRETDSVLRGKGTEIRYHYDSMNRLIKTEYPSSIPTEYEYGKAGVTDGTGNRIKRVQDESGSTDYSYGLLGEIIKETRTIKRLDPTALTDKETRSIGYQSNYLGQLEKIIFDEDDEEVVSYKYNRGGQVQKITGMKRDFSFLYVNDIGYDEFGQRVYIEYGNGVKTKYTYDEARRWLKRIETKSPNQTLVYQNMEYDFDNVGNVNRYSNDTFSHITRQNYEYDGLYQLVKVDGKSEGYTGTVLPAYYGTYNQSYTFDKTGNMVKKSSSSNNRGNTPGDNLDYTFEYEYIRGTHKASRIGNIYYAYDGNGNLITEKFGSPVTVNSGNAIVSEEGGLYSVEYGFALTQNKGQGSTGSIVYERNYLWNDRNLLRRSSDSQNHVEYRYGSDGQRVIKCTESGGNYKETLYFNKMFQINRVGTQIIESKHIYAGETRIVTKQKEAGNVNYGEEGNKQYYYHGDHLRSSQLVTDSKGNMYEHLEYTPYGELWVDHSVSGAGVNPTPFRFTGKELDTETGLYYYGARYLDPKTSRWISADPAMAEYIPGAPINDEAKKRNGNLPGQGGVFNVVNMHVYHYAGNNPVKYMDPDGKIILYFSATYNMTNFENKLGNSGKETIADAGCYITTFANVFASAVNQMSVKLANGLNNAKIYSSPTAINDNKALFEAGSGNLSGRQKTMDSLFGKGNWDYWTKEKQGISGLLNKLKEYQASDKKFLIVGIFDLSGATEKVSNHMVGITGLPDENGGFSNTVVPTSGGDAARLIDSKKAEEYNIKNLKEIRVIFVDNN